MINNTERFSKLRSEIDLIDEKIISLISSRFEITEKIGELKAHELKPAFDKNREDEILSRLSIKASRLGLNSTLIKSMYALILKEVVLNHQKKINRE